MKIEFGKEKKNINLSDFSIFVKKKIFSFEPFLKFEKLCLKSKILIILCGCLEYLVPIIIFSTEIFETTSRLIFSLLFIFFFILKILSLLTLNKIIEYAVAFITVISFILFNILTIKRLDCTTEIFLTLFQFFISFLLVFYYQLLSSKGIKKNYFIIPALLLFLSIFPYLFFGLHWYFCLLFAGLFFNLLNNHVVCIFLSETTGSYDAITIISLILSFIYEKLKSQIYEGNIIKN